MKRICCFLGGLILFGLILATSLVSEAVYGEELKTQENTTLIPILIYHRILPKALSIYDYTPEKLEEQLRFFKENGYTPITALQMIEMMAQPEKLPPKPVVLTFDDGHKSHYTKVLPLLKKYGYKATFFIYTDVIAEKSVKQLTWDELRIMQHEGMDIESHTKSHPHLTRINKKESRQTYLERLRREFQYSKLVLENQLQCKVDLLAYPYGWFNKTIETLAIEAGYRGIFTVNWGNNLPTQNRFRIKRRIMENMMSQEDLKTILSVRPLPIEVIFPEDAGTIIQAPEIKFRLTNPQTDKVQIRVRSVIDKIFRDKSGLFTWSGLKKLGPGYHMIIIKGFDENNQPLIFSWGFDYQG